MPSKKTTIHFTVISKITMDIEQPDPRPFLKHVDLRLECSGNLEKSMYLDGRDLPRKEALKPITHALVQGLMVNIKMGHEKGWWKEAEHMQYVIDELQRSFVNVGTGPAHESTM